MLVKAIKSFVGKVSMNVDEQREIIDKELARDLIKAGHVIEIKVNKITAENSAEPKKSAEKPAEKKPTGRKRK